MGPTIRAMRWWPNSVQLLRHSHSRSIEFGELKEPGVDPGRKIVSLLSRLGLGDFMKKASEINYAKLLGFESIGDLISGDIDFKDEAVAAKLGAKIGIDVQTPSETPKE